MHLTLDQHYREPLPDSRSLPCAKTHGKGQNPHGTACVVWILPGRTAKGARHIFSRQRPLSCALGKRNAQHSSLLCAIRDARQRKGFDGRPRGDSVTLSLRCATEDARDGSTLCRVLGSATHDKDWFRRQVEQVLCRASRGGAHDKEWSRHTVEQALCHVSCRWAHGKGWSRHPVP
jgi:hypothetical protein